MKKLSLLLLLTVLTLPASAKGSITAAVSPEFPNGLHYKYLNYLAQQLGVEIQIYPMPLARRLQELKKGSLDILLLSHRDSSELIFIEPAYEKIPFALFLREQDKDRVKEKEDMNGFRIGYSIGANLPSSLETDDKVKTVAVSSLQQKITMLELNRIDAFFHALESVERKLENMNKDEEIVKSHWQPSYERNYHFVISKHSALYNHQDKLSMLIDHALKNDVFSDIRKQHYQ